MRFFLILSILLTSLQVFAGAKVSEIKEPDVLWAKLDPGSNIKTGARVIVISLFKGEVIGVGEVRDRREHEDGSESIKVRIKEIVGNYMIMVGDEVEPLDATIFQRKKVPGFNSLSLSNSRKIPSQYKELAYFGVFTSEGHTLDKNEVLLSPFQIQYGVTNEFNAKIVNALWLDGYANLGAKYRIVRNKYVKITGNVFGAYKVQSQDRISQLGGVITMPKNAKFQSHFMATFTMDPQFEEARATEGLGLFQDSDIRSITEYVTDSWDRVLFGPVYNVELQTFGGTVSYMWIWTTFHMSLGLATRDFSNLNFEDDGYYYVYDLFWRF